MRLRERARKKRVKLQLREEIKEGRVARLGRAASPALASNPNQLEVRILVFDLRFQFQA